MLVEVRCFDRSDLTTFGGHTERAILALGGCAMQRKPYHEGYSREFSSKQFAKRLGEKPRPR